MTEISQHVDAFTQLQPCNLGLASQWKGDARLSEYAHARAEVFASCARPARRICVATFSPRPSTTRLFHHRSSAAQTASSLCVALSQDDDGSARSEEVATLRDDLRDHSTGEEKNIREAIPRKTFRLDIPKVNIQSALETMKAARTHGLTTEEVVLRFSPQPARPLRLPDSDKNDERLAASMKAALEKSTEDKEQKGSLHRRRRLPLMAEDTQKAVLELVNDNDVAIILAQTGSGKTTQVPQILVDEMIMSGRGPTANVVCTQPRRIAATNVAHNVALERHEAARNSVGYHIRNANFVPKLCGSITYCTTGILLNRLIADPERILSTHSHIIVDEVHERDIQIDLVLSLLRNAVRERKVSRQPYPKIILMSATIDPSSFLRYSTRAADDGTALTAACLEVEGRHAHIEDYYLPEILKELTGQPMRQYIEGNHLQSSKEFVEREMKFAAQQAKDGTDLSHNDASKQEPPPGAMRIGLAASVIAHIATTKPEGDILAFFPGSSDMVNAEQLLRSGHFVEGKFDIGDPSRFRLFKLHSMLKDTNNEVFDPVPQGCRRIILATNIAETSITLPEVVYVVDSGFRRSSCFDHATLARSLPYRWISKTSSIQRRGRTGRVRDGHYYALFTKERYESFNPMNRPEIGEADLAAVALQFKAFEQNAEVEEILLDTMDPPSRHAIANATRQLRSLGALTETGAISSLGRLLWQLGVHPTLGKAILLGSLFGCLEPMLIVACHDPGAPLLANFHLSNGEIKEVKKQYLPDDETDFAWIIEAFREYHAADSHGRQELRRSKHVRHASYLDMMMASEGIHDVLARIGFAPPPQPGKTLFEVLPRALNANRDNMALVKGLLINTVSAELAIWEGAETARSSNWTIDSPLLKGLLAKNGTNEAKTPSQRRIKKRYRSHGRLMAYTYKREILDLASPVDTVFLEQSSMISPLLAVLFCRSLTLQPDQTLVLNNWLKLQFSVPAEVPSAIAEQTAAMLMELRKTIDRFTSLAWAELERLYQPKDGRTSSPSEQQPPRPRLGSRLRKVMVEAILKMLADDQAYWQEFRTKRRTEIAAALEIERLEKEAAKIVRLEKGAAEAVSSVKAQERDSDSVGDEDGFGDDHELEGEVVAAALSRLGTE